MPTISRDKEKGFVFKTDDGKEFAVDNLDKLADMREAMDVARSKQTEQTIPNESKNSLKVSGKWGFWDYKGVLLEQGWNSSLIDRDQATKGIDVLTDFIYKEKVVGKKLEK